jgi:hypothetical protein
MFDRWFSSATEIITTAAAAAVLIYLGYEINRRQKKLRDLFFVLGPDSAVMAEHRRPLQPEAAGAAMEVTKPGCLHCYGPVPI